MAHPESVGYDGGGLDEDPVELAVRVALEQQAYVEGYRTPEELAVHRPDIAQQVTEATQSRFPTAPESEAA